MARNMKDETSNRKATQKANQDGSNRSNQNGSNRATQKATNSADSDCGCGGKRGESEKKK